MEAGLIAYKFLRADGRSPFTAFAWPLPHRGPGAWVEAEIELCRSGIHACRPADLPLWVNRALYEIELDGEVVEEETKVVAPRGRLLRRLAAWEDGLCEDYCRWCAGRARELAASGGLEAWTAAIEPSLPAGAGTLGFIAARIAEEHGGAGEYHAERERQAEWLAGRLGPPGRARNARRTRADWLRWLARRTS